MSQRAYGPSRGSRGVSTYKRVRGDAADDDNVLLPLYGSVPRFRSMVPAPELKFLDTYLNYQILSVDSAMSGGILAPSAIASVPVRGDGPSNFSGRGVRIKSWCVRGSFLLSNEDVMAYPCSGRLAFIALVLDTQTNGTQCTSQQIFTNPGNTVAAMCSPHVNLLNSDRFVILARKTVEVNPQTLSIYFLVPPDVPEYQQSGVRVPFEFFVPLDLPVLYKSFGSQIADVIDNSLHVVMFQSYYDATLALHYASVSGGYSSRIRFLDYGM